MKFNQITITILVIAMLLLIPAEISTKERVELPPPQPRTLAQVPEPEQTTLIELPTQADGSFKTYMSYKAITNKASKQYEMQQLATTNEQGFRMYDGRYMVAVGTGIASECGVKLRVTLESGLVLECITGDIKSNAHTDVTNKYVEKNGNIVEFIVDTKEIPCDCKLMGDMSHAGLEGAIVRMEVVHD